jgi:hypothetical protein
MHADCPGWIELGCSSDACHSLVDLDNDEVESQLEFAGLLESNSFVSLRTPLPSSP